MRSDYVRTDQLEDTLVPLDTLEALFGVSRWTIMRWIELDGIARHAYAGGKAVRWGDIPHGAGKRWRKKDTPGK